MTAFAIIGFGEVGGIFARDLHAAGVSRLLAYDSAEAACVRAAACGYVEVRNTAAEAAAGADVVFVSVTAGSTVKAAASLAGGLGQAPFVVDVNSVSPTTKQEAARIVGQAGGRYVEAAVMTGVPPGACARPCCSAVRARRPSPSSRRGTICVSGFFPNGSGMRRR